MVLYHNGTVAMSHRRVDPFWVGPLPVLPSAQKCQSAYLDAQKRQIESGETQMTQKT